MIITKKYIKYFVIVLWVFSILGVFYVEQKPQYVSENLKTSNDISNIKEFDNFYEIYFQNPNQISRLIGIKQEKFKKKPDKYVYSISMRFNKLIFQKYQANMLDNIYDINGFIEFSIDGKIDKINLLFIQKYLLDGEKTEDGKKILVKLNDVNGDNLFSKLFDIDEINFNFFLINSLPYKHYEKNKTYAYEFLHPNFLSQKTGIKKTSLTIKKIDDKEYSVTQSFLNIPLTTKIIFDENSNVKYESNGILTTKLITDKKSIERSLADFASSSKQNTGIVDLGKTIVGSNQNTGIDSNLDIEKNVKNIIDQAKQTSKKKTCNILNK